MDSLHSQDWFHVTIRLAVMGQMNKGRESEPASFIQSVEKHLEGLEHPLWNGNVGPAQTVIDVLKLLVERETMSPERKKLLKAVEDFGGYIAANRDFIPDYGDAVRFDDSYVAPLDWCPDGQWLVVSGSRRDGEPSHLMLVSAENGQVRDLTSGNTSMHDLSPRFSPDGRYVSFVRGSHPSTGAIFVQALSPAMEPKGAPQRLN